MNREKQIFPWFSKNPHPLMSVFRLSDLDLEFVNQQPACSPDVSWPLTEQCWLMAGRGRREAACMMACRGSSPAFVPFPPPWPTPPLTFCLRAPQVVGDVWWWKALVMDLFWIHAHLNWCDSSPISTEQPLYCLCLGVNACWMDEFHYQHECVSLIDMD